MRFITTLSAILVTVTGSLAQDSLNIKALSFEEAIRLGLKNNVTLNTQRNTLYSAQARKLQGYANYLPNLSANGFAQRTDGLQIDPTTGDAGNVSSDYVQGSIQAGWVVFNGFNRVNTLKANNDLFDAQSSFVERSKQDVVFNVASQYLQVLLDQELYRIAQENLRAQTVTLEQMRGFVEVGARAATDEYNQNAQVQNLQVLALRAKMQLENDRALLAQTLQLDASVPLRVVKPEFVNNIDYFKSLSLDSLYQIALQNRKDLRQAEELAEAAKHGIRAATAGYYPTVSLFVSYGSTYYASDLWKLDPDNIPRPESFGIQFGQLNPSLSYGLNLNIPIFDRLQTRTNRVVSKVQYNNAKLTRDNLVNTIKIDVQRSFKNYETAIESYEASQAQFQAGELALTTQSESYNLGISTQVALAQANQTFVQAASSKAQAEVTLIFQQMLLEYYLGTLKVESLIGQ